MDHRLKLKHLTTKLLENNVRENLQDIELGKEFFNLTSNTQFVKGKFGNLDLTKIKNFYSLKDPIKRMKKYITDWKKIFSNHIFNKRHI